MKPCLRKRKSLAWLAAGCLEQNKAEPLRAHLGQCAGCRDYFESLTSLAGQLRPANLQVQPSPFLHRRVMGALRQEPSAPVLRWSMALPAVALAAVVLAFILPWRQKPAVPVPATVPAAEMAPTLLNYQLVANQSLDQLDALLTRQSRPAQPALKIFRAADLSGAAITDETVR